MKKLLSLLLLACLTIGMLFGCGVGDQGSSSNSGNTQIEVVDYAGSVTLDMTSTTTLKKEVQMKSHIDGDTTHFYIDKAFQQSLGLSVNYLKARYIAVNTPESTGKVEPWGKKASNFTKEKLTNASSIVIETNGDKWDKDSTGDRFLLWIWYKTKGTDTYRNLNVELLQEGLAVANKSSSSLYGDACSKAFNQAKTLQLHVHDKDKDPDFYYGEAIELTLKELRTNIKEYDGMRVAFEATATEHNDWNVYLEDYDEDTGLYFGISAFYGYNSSYHSILATGNRVRIVGNVSYYEAGGTYQISDLRYSKMKPKDPDNIQNLGSGYEAGFAEIDIPQFNSNVSCQVLDHETNETVTKSYKYAELAMSTTVSMKNLKVVDASTTDNGGSNDGAMTLTCQDDKGNEITVRTIVLKDTDGNLITKSYFLNKTIDVKGIIDMFDGEYQIKLFWIGDVIVH